MWYLLNQYIEAVWKHQTPIGWVWTFNAFFFRFSIISYLMKDLYENDGSDFRCDTSQVGCAQICFNQYNPISVQRFRSIEIIFISVPWLIFYGYAMSINNKLAKFKEHRKKLIHYQKLKSYRDRKRRAYKLKQGVN